MKKILFLGLGNPILSDDAVGIRTVEEIKNIVGERDEIGFTVGNIAGLGILDVIQGYDELVIVDAVEKGGTPGSLYTIPLDELDNSIHLTSIHSINLATAIEFGKKMGMKVPSRISIYGIEVRDVVNFSEKMTREVEKSTRKNAKEIVKREMTKLFL